MSIRTLQELTRQGPVVASLVECVDENGIKTEDYEVQCESIECDRYACTHLRESEALEEVEEHARLVHGL